MPGLYSQGAAPVLPAKAAKLYLITHKRARQNFLKCAIARIGLHARPSRSIVQCTRVDSQELRGYASLPLGRAGRRGRRQRAGGDADLELRRALTFPGM